MVCFVLFFLCHVNLNLIIIPAKWWRYEIVGWNLSSFSAFEELWDRCTTPRMASAKICCFCFYFSLLMYHFLSISQSALLPFSLYITLFFSYLPTPHPINFHFVYNTVVSNIHGKYHKLWVNNRIGYNWHSDKWLLSFYFK